MAITDHESAVAAARGIAPVLATGASARDSDRALPFDVVEALTATGLLAVTVPAEFGGPGLGARPLAEVVAVLAAADPSVAQIPQSHFVFVDAARRVGSDVLKKHLFSRVLDGARVANAQTERGGKTVLDDATTLRRRDGRLRLTGSKFYATGAVFADILAVRAIGPDGGSVIAYVPADAAGITIDDDWDGLGQRTTSSGTVLLDDVDVNADLVLDYTRLLATPSTYGTRAQLVHAAIDVGIARGALDSVPELADRARPWFEAGVERAAEDPLLVAQAGELELAVRSAAALLREAADRIDEAEAASTPETIADAALATAAAKVAAGRAARRAGSELFDFGGTRTASGRANLDRYWRDARTHTLHDPERWKLQHLGRWAVERQPPPSHGTL
ncbi:SfnB family sulfur acquisition oxidoreductase [Gordonia sp. HY002]|uniref:SfnB family sulfur acquisition oxidoreductase n=1 Tax=Gordonia zhenghanii TaxID=2911516 RepID=UPI001EEFA6AA|nr:SfnB family sulfur acquisition oxidoreductase [Gordonia zhenghanii]MCF8571803.1 SfnB family sulfur acquisition oxidoreductase [Gordonia zhenghanii]MCF8604815.1 SfnB family sulfur acquisition oxidoreductase [Gordonia zhenghanii]